MKPWTLHLDHQLYKALEHQYQLGLEALNENLPEIKVELIFRCGSSNLFSFNVKKNFHIFFYFRHLFYFLGLSVYIYVYVNYMVT